MIRPVTSPSAAEYFHADRLGLDLETAPPIFRGGLLVFAPSLTRRVMVAGPPRGVLQKMDANFREVSTEVNTQMAKSFGLGLDPMHRANERPFTAYYFQYRRTVPREPSGKIGEVVARLLLPEHSTVPTDNPPAIENLDPDTVVSLRVSAPVSSWEEESANFARFSVDAYVGVDRVVSGIKWMWAHPRFRTIEDSVSVFSDGRTTL